MKTPNEIVTIYLYSLGTGDTDEKIVVALGRIATIIEKDRKRVMNIYRRYVALR